MVREAIGWFIDVGLERMVAPKDIHIFIKVGLERVGGRKRPV